MLKLYLSYEAINFEHLKIFNARLNLNTREFSLFAFAETNQQAWSFYLCTLS